MMLLEYFVPVWAAVVMCVRMLVVCTYACGVYALYQIMQQNMIYSSSLDQGFCISFLDFYIYGELRPRVIAILLVLLVSLQLVVSCT